MVGSPAFMKNYTASHSVTLPSGAVGWQRLDFSTLLGASRYMAAVSLPVAVTDAAMKRCQREIPSRSSTTTRETVYAGRPSQETQLGSTRD